MSAPQTPQGVQAATPFSAFPNGYYGALQQKNNMGPMPQQNAKGAPGMTGGPQNYSAGMPGVVQALQQGNPNAQGMLRQQVGLPAQQNSAPK